MFSIDHLTIITNTGTNKILGLRAIVISILQVSSLMLFTSHWLG
jgi:hypothetical protein